MRLDRRAGKLVEFISGRAARYGLKTEDLAGIIGRTPQTARNRLRNPETLTVGELYALGDKLHFKIQIEAIE